MTSTIHQMYKNLEKCTESLEQDIELSLEQLNVQKNVDHNLLALEASKDYHYREILSHLTKIKDHIKLIADHDHCIQAIQAKIGSGHTRIDKNYIKKQVETFQRFGAVNKREHKPNRPLETSSMELLECWENFLDQQQSLTIVKKRQETTRKKRLVSSTLEPFLDFESDCTQLETLHEDATEAINEPVVKVPEDTKPRIVEVIYKKNVNV